MSLPVSWHFVWQDQGTVVALSPVCSLCESWEVWTWGRWEKKKKERKKEKKTTVVFRWGCFCFDWECPADRSSLASLQ